MFVAHRSSSPPNPVVSRPRRVAVAVAPKASDVGWFFAALFALVSSFVLVSSARGVSPEPDSQSTAAAASTGGSGSEAKEAVAVLGGGCFWCTEAVYERMEGVTDVVSGYIGGRNPNPNYRQVCSGLTGHAEAVQIFFDPAKTSFQEILEVFFKTHDPTTLNRQGDDAGTQYRSAIFYQNDEQKQIAADYIAKLDKEGDFRNPIVTTLEPPTKFYVAEEYHQDYFRRNPNAAYCQRVVVDKVRKFNRNFGDKIKK